MATLGEIISDDPNAGLGEIVSDDPFAGLDAEVDAPQQESPSILRNAGAAFVDTLSGFIPKSPGEVLTMTTPIGHVIEQAKPAWGALRDIISGKPVAQAFEDNLPLAKTMAEAERSEPWSKKRFEAGFQTLANLGMAFGLKPAIRQAQLSRAPVTKTEVDGSPFETVTREPEPPIIPEPINEIKTPETLQREAPAQASASEAVPIVEAPVEPIGVTASIAEIQRRNGVAPELPTPENTIEPRTTPEVGAPEASRVGAPVSEGTLEPGAAPLPEPQPRPASAGVGEAAPRETPVAETLYHQTAVKEPFTEFKVQPGASGVHYFSTRKDVLSRMIKAGASDDVSKPTRVVTADVTVKNPLDLRTAQEKRLTPQQWVQVFEDAGVSVPESIKTKATGVRHDVPAWEFLKVGYKDLVQSIKDAGFDGIKYDEWGGTTTGVFDSSQIKIATKGKKAAPAEVPVAPEIPIKPGDEAYAGVAPKQSKIGKSIEAKAVEAKLADGFAHVAEYDPITIADQAQRATGLIRDNLETARAVIRGEQPLPADLRGTALITAMEEHILRNPDAQLSYELANSRLTGATSAAAQEMRLMAERVPDSLTAKFREIREARRQGAEKRGQTVEKVKAEMKTEIQKVAAKAPAWEAFVRLIAC